MDILWQAAMNYKDLLNKKYLIIVAKSCKARSYVIQFSTDRFKHICGLHKLKDIKNLNRSSSETLFNQIVQGKISLQDIKNSKLANIEERIKNVAQLEKYFDNFDEIYDWDCKKSKFSDINADIMIPIKSSVTQNQDTYIFLKKFDGEKKLEILNCIVEKPDL